MVQFQEKKSTKSTKKAKVTVVPGPSGEQPTPSTSGEHLPSSPSDGATTPSPGGDTSPAKSQQGALPTTPLSPEQKDLIAEKQLSAKLKLTTKNTEGLVTDFGLTWFKALQAEFTKPYFLQVGDINIAHILQCSRLRIDNSRQNRFSSGRAYPQFIHSHLIASQIIIH